MLEVLKWASAADLCTGLNLVSSLWQQAADCNEVWDVLCEACGLDASHSGEPLKASFLRQYSNLAVYMVSGGWLRGFDVRRRRWKAAVPLQTKARFDNLSSIVVYQCYLVVTGTGYPYTSQSALIHYKTGEVTPLPNMISPRSRHGSLVYENSVYVFAGTSDYEQYSDKAEKLHLQVRTQWTALPWLLCKFTFSSPCRKDHFAYFFGGWGTCLCQRFDLDREIYSLLPFKTPMNDTLTTAFVYHSDIYFCQSEHIGQWQDREGVQLVVSQFLDATNFNW